MCQNRQQDSRFLKEGFFLLPLFLWILGIGFFSLSPCWGEDAKSVLEQGIYHESREEYVEAAVWYHRGAEEGILEAQHRLGMMCWKGQGVSQDSSQAFMWFYLAGAQGNIASSVMCATLGDVLTPEEIDRGREAAREMLKR